MDRELEILIARRAVEANGPAIAELVFGAYIGEFDWTEVVAKLSRFKSEAQDFVIREGVKTEVNHAP